jgi:lysozyme family protein
VRCFVVAVIHEREAGGRWDRPLGQADHLNEVSTHFPRGSGPFLDHPGNGPGHNAFHEGAVDALTNCPMYAVPWKLTVSGTQNLSHAT